MKIGVLGSGVMGAGIAQVMATSGHEVVATDVSEESLDKARVGTDTGRFGIKRAVERGKLTEEEAASALDRLHFTSDATMLHDADVIIEAVPENLDLKIREFRRLDEACGPDTIFASNSSGFPCQALAAATDRPDKVIVWHWASPAPVMKLAEIVRGPDTSDATVDTIVELAREAGKNPIVVKDQPMAWGYVANRVYFATIAEADRVVREGIATAEEVDQLMMDTFGWPVGPLAMVRGATSGWD